MPLSAPLPPPNGTAHIAEEIHRCLLSLESPTSEQLHDVLAAIPDPSAFAGSARFSAESYTRVPILRTDRYEVRLLCWGPGQSSALHGHGGSACAFRVISGRATEFKVGGEIGQLDAGQIGLVRGKEIHQVNNLEQAPLLTLHLYAPPLPVDQPSTAAGRQVVILGGGFSGAALAIHLLRSEDAGLRITLVEPGPSIGRGVAYDTPDPAHVLNVPASKMSILPDRPDDFFQWARERLPGVTPDALLSRRRYGDYVQQRLGEAILTSPGKLRLARCAAKRVVRRGAGWAVSLSDGRVLEAAEVILATGHGPPAQAGLEGVAGHPALHPDPWAPDLYAKIGAEDRVLLVGTGLTAVDILLSLKQRGHRAPIRATSRNGRWPMPHLASVTWKGRAVSLPVAEAPRTAGGLAFWLRRQIQRAAGDQIPWQAVIDAVRPHIGTLWGRLPAAERQRLLATHRADWEIYRHRIPCASWDAIHAAREAGGLYTHAGGVRAVEPEGAALRVDLGGAAHTFDHVILCAGQISDPRSFRSPVWDALIADGLVTPDPAGLGIVSDHSGDALGLDGRPTGLRVLGGLRRPHSFEATAVPELSQQAAALAARIAPPTDERWDGDLRAPLCGVQP